MKWPVMIGAAAVSSITLALLLGTQTSVSIPGLPDAPPSAMVFISAKLVAKDSPSLSDEDRRSLTQRSTDLDSVTALQQSATLQKVIKGADTEAQRQWDPEVDAIFSTKATMADLDAIISALPDPQKISVSSSIEKDYGTEEFVNANRVSLTVEQGGSFYLIGAIYTTPVTSAQAPSGNQTSPANQTATTS